jgi:hypothetical protein
VSVSLRRAILTALIGLTLLLPAAAQAHSSTASAGGIRATLSYSGGPGITTKDERLSIVENGRSVYDQAVPRQGCVSVCGPGTKQPVAVTSLYGDDGEDVVLNLFSGGADCCTIADVYVHSAAVGSYVLDQHNFGEAGFKLENIGPAGRPEFVSADKSFYCEFTVCAASALPLQIFEFEDERFVNVTEHYPKLISRDAAHWAAVFNHDPKQGLGAFAAEVADLESLNEGNGLSVALVDQAPKAHLTRDYLIKLTHFLRVHHYRTSGL